MESMHDFYSKMEEGNILLSFKGEITSDLLTSVLQIMESKMDTLEEPPRIKKKVYNILVECLQNLYHHVDEDDLKNKADKSALFMIKRKDGEYSIMTGNFITNDSVESMRSRLDKINEMDQNELKDHYKEILNNGEMSSKGGGGLGMIDIARKSGKKIDYNFTNVDPIYSFFSLDIKIA